MSNYLEEAKEKYENCGYEEALELCNKQIELGSELDNAYRLRCLIKFELAYDKENETEILYDALKDIRKYIEYNPNNGSGYFTSSIIQERLEDYEDAIISINKGLEYSCNDENYYVQRADICAKLNRKKEAAADYTTAIEISPTSDNYIKRGDFYKDIEDYESAKNDYISAINIEKNKADGLIELADIYAELDQYEDAIIYYNKATSSNWRLIKTCALSRLAPIE